MGFFFFRATSYLLAGTEKLYAYFRLKVTKFIRSNGDIQDRMHKHTLNNPKWTKTVYGLQKMRILAAGQIKA